MDEHYVECQLYSDYIVSDKGEVISKKDGVILKQYIQKSGYSYVWLDRGNGMHSVPVHKLVCIAFHGIDGYRKGLYVDHINTDRSDNRASNLRWVTPKENSNNPLTLEKRRKKKMRLIPFDQHLDECIGKIGTPDRDELEENVANAISNYRNSKRRFSVCIMNPPYAHGLHEKFLEKVLLHSHIVCTVQPTSWVLGKTQNKVIENILDTTPNKTEIEIIPVAKFFDAGFLGQVSIDTISFNEKSKIEVYNNGIISKFDKISEITNYSIDPLLNSFNSHIQEAYKRDNLQNHLLQSFRMNSEQIEELAREKKYIVRISGIRGHVDQISGEKMDDFYTIISNNPREHREKVLLKTENLLDKDKYGNSIIKLFFVFDTKRGQICFFNYLKSFFVRACFMLIKNNVHFDGGELRYVPWLDFENEDFLDERKIDDILFKRFRIPNKVRKYIKENLSDYYGFFSSKPM